MLCLCILLYYYIFPNQKAQLQVIGMLFVSHHHSSCRGRTSLPTWCWSSLWGEAPLVLSGDITSHLILIYYAGVWPAHLKRKMNWPGINQQGCSVQNVLRSGSSLRPRLSEATRRLVMAFYLTQCDHLFCRASAPKSQIVVEWKKKQIRLWRSWILI